MDSLQEYIREIIDEISSDNVNESNVNKNVQLIRKNYEKKGVDELISTLTKRFTDEAFKKDIIELFFKYINQENKEYILECCADISEEPAKKQKKSDDDEDSDLDEVLMSIQLLEQQKEEYESKLQKALAKTDMGSSDDEQSMVEYLSKLEEIEQEIKKLKKKQSESQKKGLSKLKKKKVELKKKRANKSSILAVGTYAPLAKSSSLYKLLGADFYRFGVEGDGTCFFHGLLATHPPKIPEEYQNYREYDETGREVLGQDFRLKIAKLVEDPKTQSLKDLINVMRHNFQLGDQLDSLDDIECYMGQEGWMLIEEIYGIKIVILRLVTDNIYTCDVFNRISPDDPIVLLMNVSDMHYEPIVQINDNGSVVKSIFNINDPVIQRLKKSCEIPVPFNLPPVAMPKFDDKQSPEVINCIESLDIDTLREIVRTMDVDPEGMNKKDICILLNDMGMI